MTYREQLVKRKPDADRPDRTEPDRAEKVEPADAPTQAELVALDVEPDATLIAQRSFAEQRDEFATVELRSKIGDHDRITEFERRPFFGGSLESGGVKKIGKRPQSEILPEGKQFYELNPHGEDYSAIDTQTGAMAVADGNSSLPNSAETAKRVADAAILLLNSVPESSKVEEIISYLEANLHQLTDALNDLRGNGGTTVMASRYFEQLGKTIIIDIGDCEAYLVRQSKTSQVMSPRSMLKQLGSWLGIGKSQRAVSNALKQGIFKRSDRNPIIFDQREDVTPMVFAVDSKPGDLMVHVTDGLRNNLKGRRRMADANLNREVVDAMANTFHSTSSGEYLPTSEFDDMEFVVRRLET